MLYWRRVFSILENIPCSKPSSLWRSKAWRFAYERSVVKYSELVRRWIGACYRAGCRYRPGADGGVDGSRCPETDLAKQRSGILVAFAQETLAQGRRIRAYPEGERDTSRLRW